MRKLLWLLMTLLFTLDGFIVARAAEIPIVHAVLFYSSACPHCHDVIQNVLSPLFKQYSEQLQMIGVDTTNGNQPTATATAAASAPAPQIVEETSSDAPLWMRRFQQDVTGNSLAVALLVVMLICLVWSVWIVLLGERIIKPLPQTRWLIPLLCIAGIGVAGYMSFVETTGTAAFCGPVGNCNAVQQSQYATLFGVLPVGIFGLIGYAVLFAAWAAYVFGKPDLQRIGQLALWGLSLFGILFSIYLTFLEPFVIGATCVWCLSSATLMTLLLWITTPLATQAWNTEDEDDQPQPEIV